MRKRKALRRRKLVVENTRASKVGGVIGFCIAMAFIVAEILHRNLTYTHYFVIHQNRSNATTPTLAIINLLLKPTALMTATVASQLSHPSYYHGAFYHILELISHLYLIISGSRHSFLLLIKTASTWAVQDTQTNGAFAKTTSSDRLRPSLDSQRCV
jgi:hypothetical protein